MNPHDVTRELETELCLYTGARYAVAVNSCTMALLLAVRWKIAYYSRWPFGPATVTIPKRTYVSVPASIIHAGAVPAFEDLEWSGGYELKPLQVWDYARRFTSGMYRAGTMQCVSFHATKILADSQGGAILHDDREADKWLRRMRFDGRTERVQPAEDRIVEVGWHCYLSPDVAARLLWKMAKLPRDNPDLPNDDYPDLSKQPAFTPFPGAYK